MHHDAQALQDPQMVQLDRDFEDEKSFQGTVVLICNHIFIESSHVVKPQVNSTSKR